MTKIFTDLSIEQGVKALDWCVRRQRLISANIANRDTPGYRARDVDFKALMEDVYAGQDPGEALRRTNPRHLLSSHGTLSTAVIVKNSSDRLDGNTVDVGQEMSNLVENGLTYQAVLKRLSRKFQALKLAINGGG